LKKRKGRGTCRGEFILVGESRMERRGESGSGKEREKRVGRGKKIKLGW
jgi:hypothetical protein